MKFKSMIACAVMAMGSLVMNADDNMYLHISTSDGYKVIDISTVNRISFVGDKMIVSDKNNQSIASFNRSALDAMSVTETSTPQSGIEDVLTAEDGGLKFNADSRTVEILEDCDFEVYDVAGRRLVMIPGVTKGQKVSLEGMHPGTVIIKAGNHTLKTVLK